MIAGLLLAAAPCALPTTTQDAAASARLQRVEERALEARFEPHMHVDEEGNPQVTLTASNLSFKRLVTWFGTELRLEVKGLQDLPRDPSVFVQLKDRSPKEALEWIAGSAGLYVRVGATKIEVTEELPTYPSKADLYERARNAVFQAMVQHPRSPQAPRAAWVYAAIEAETPGRELESAKAYDRLVEDYPDSDLVPGALLEAGKQFGLAGQWRSAIDRFDDLASHRTPHPFGVEARRRLADAHTRLAAEALNPDVARENGSRALLVLDSLDDNAPSQEAHERRERLLIRARAYSLVGDPMNALRSIDLAASYSAYGDRDPELMDLRATALDRAGQYQDAFLAWHQAAETATGAARAEGLRRAAASANACNAHLAAIATWKTADLEGLGRYLTEEYNRALIGLGMEPDSTLVGDRDKITRGERFLTSRRYQEAVDVFRPVFDRRFGLGREERQGLVLSYARALERVERLDEAINVLRTAAQESELVADRREFYQLASVLYERNGDIDRAITALNGSL